MKGAVHWKFECAKLVCQWTMRELNRLDRGNFILEVSSIIDHPGHVLYLICRPFKLGTCIGLGVTSGGNEVMKELVVEAGSKEDAETQCRHNTRSMNLRVELIAIMYK